MTKTPGRYFGRRNWTRIPRDLPRFTKLAGANLSSSPPRVLRRSRRTVGLRTSPSRRERWRRRATMFSLCRNEARRGNRLEAVLVISEPLPDAWIANRSRDRQGAEGRRKFLFGCDGKSRL